MLKTYTRNESFFFLTRLSWIFKLILLLLTLYKLSIVVVYLAREHSNEDEHEDKSRDGKKKHKDALHEAWHYMLCLIIYLFYFSICCINVLLLLLGDIFDDTFILLKLLLEALSKLLHPRYHLEHIIFYLSLLCSFISLNFVEIYFTSFFTLFLFLWLLL